MGAAISRLFFFFNDTATTEIYTLSLHDALPICRGLTAVQAGAKVWDWDGRVGGSRLPDGRYILQIEGTADGRTYRAPSRSEEHTSELQSRQYLVCRLLLEKKTNDTHRTSSPTRH